MRWQVILQSAVGVGALFGLASLAVERKIMPLAEDQSALRASAEARVGALDVERAWLRSRRSLEKSAFFLAKSRAFHAEDLDDSLERQVESAAEQVGARGRAALFDAEGELLAGAATLGKSTAVREARAGAAARRIEWLGEVPHEVAAVPLTPGEASRVLVLARPIDRLRLSGWVRGLPVSTVVVLLDGTEVIATLMREDQVQPARARRLPPLLTIKGAEHAVAEARLPDEAGVDVRVVALAPVAGPQYLALRQALMWMLFLLGVVSFLLVSALSLLAPGAARAAPVVAAPVSAPSPLGAGASATTSGLHPAQSGVYPAASSGVPGSGLFPSQTARPELASAAPVGSLPSAVSAPSSSPVASGSFPAAGPRLGGIPSLAARPSGSGFDPPASPATPVAPRPDAFGTYSGVPTGASERIPGAPADFDATPHSSAQLEPLPPRPSSSREASLGGQMGPSFSRPSSEGLEAMGLTGSAGLSSPSLPRSSTPAPPPVAPSMPPVPPPAPPADDAPSFDAIARAAHSARPSIPASGTDENLPAPKGGLSPGMVAAQGLAQRGQVTAPSPRHEGNLPIPKEQASHLYDLSPGAAPERAGLQGSPGLTRGTGSFPPLPKAVTADIGRASEARPFDREHYRRVYDEFVAAKTELGESVEGLSFEGFGAKLRASEESLLQQHSCRAVRFQVIVKDQAVSLRPQLVR